MYGRVSVAVVVSLGGVLAASSARAAPCPRAFVYGPSRPLVAEIEWRLAPTPTTGSPRGCAPVTVEVSLQDDGLHLVRSMSGVRIERVVQNLDTAVSLISSWTRSGADELLGPDEGARFGAPRLADTSTVSTIRRVTRGRAPFEARTRPPRRPAPPPPHRSPWYLAAGPLGTASDSTGLAGGLEIAWPQRIGDWRLGPTLRGQYDRTPDSREVSGARSFEVAVGLRGGHRFGDDTLGLTPGLGLSVTLRHVQPTQYVGPMSCIAPGLCDDPTSARPIAPGFDALTVWLDGGVTAEWWASDDVGLALGASFGVNPGHRTPDPTQGTIVSIGRPVEYRANPTLPRWRATTRIAVLWEGP